MGAGRFQREGHGRDPRAEELQVCHGTADLRTPISLLQSWLSAPATPKHQNPLSRGTRMGPRRRRWC
jgi:hypothetical protein